MFKKVTQKKQILKIAKKNSKQNKELLIELYKK